jgi:hypothetical protein
MAILKCSSARIFEMENADPGCIELCGSKLPGPTGSFTLFSSCYAETPRAMQGKASGWAVPNLNTLITEKKSGFTHVSIKSTVLSSQLAGANRYSYAIRVNGTPIYIDGFQPRDLMRSFRFTEGINLEFGLQNLGFSGKNDGFEKIEVHFEFFTDTRLIQQTVCSFDYVALRSSATREIVTPDGSKFQWEANYKVPGGTEYEVFNLSSTDILEIRRSKQKIDNAMLTYKGIRIVGVIRPPLPPNKNYGVILGLELSNKQIRFLYSLEEAKEMINWAKQQPGTNFSRSMYVYRITEKQRMTGNDGK